MPFMAALSVAVGGFLFDFFPKTLNFLLATENFFVVPGILVVVKNVVFFIHPPQCAPKTPVALDPGAARKKFLKT